jgi:predicted small lipoprotein YifL
MGTPAGRRKTAVVVLALVALLAGCGRRRPLHVDAGPGDGAAAETAADMPDAAPTPDAPDDRSGSVDRAGADAGLDHAGADAGFGGALVSFCHDLAAHLCAARERCQAMMNVLPAECASVEEARCTSQLDVWQATAAAKGRLKIEPSRAPACFTFLDDARCDQIDFAYGYIPACARVLAGTVGDGEPCVYPAECAGGICDMGDVPECVGWCVSHGRVGGPCGDLLPDCDSETAWCDWSTKKCVAKKARGEACTDREGAAETQCANADHCRSPHGVPCNHTPDDAADCTCAPRAGVGAACQSRDQCQRDLYCVKGACAAEIPEGEPCPGRGCAVGLICDPTDPALGSAGSCWRRPERRQPLEGEDCLPSLPPCLGENVYCSGETYKCTRLPTVGQRCFDYCDATSYCPNAAGSPMKCLRKKAGGAICSESVECQSGSCEHPRGCSPINCPTRCAEVCSYLSADGGF